MRRVVVPVGCVRHGRARLEGSIHHHLTRVLRLRPGEVLELRDGTGVVYRGLIDEITAAEVVVAVHETVAAETAPVRPRLTLIYGLSRRCHTEWVLQKATEIGADAIVLASCERSPSRPEGERKAARWEEIIRQAARQCGRASWPTVRPPSPLADALAGVAAAEVRLIAQAGGPPLSAIQSTLSSRAEDLALAVGPEGGFAEQELQQAELLGYRPVGLGPNVLRTETAAVVLLALAAFLCGRLDYGCPSLSA